MKLKLVFYSEPCIEGLTPLLSRDVATKSVVLVTFTVQTVGKNVKASWLTNLEHAVDVMTLDDHALGLDSVGRMFHVGGCSIPVEWYDFNFLKNRINERER